MSNQETMEVTAEVDRLDPGASMEQETTRGNCSDSDDMDFESAGDESGNDNSDDLDTDDDFSSLREEAMKMTDSDYLTVCEGDVYNKKKCPNDFFPEDFYIMYEQLYQPRTMDGVVNLSDSDSDDGDKDTDMKEPKCFVPSCTSRKEVRPRSRLVTSYYGLNYLESPVFCLKCFKKACKFYKKVAKITPSTPKLLVNDSKPMDYIDMSRDGHIQPDEQIMIENNSLATDIAKNVHTHIHNVAVKYNIEEKFNKAMDKVESDINKMIVWVNELNCKIDKEDQDMMRNLQLFYSSYNPTLHDLEPVDLGIVDPDHPEVHKTWDAGELAISKDRSEENQIGKPSSSTIEIDSYNDPDIAIVEAPVESSSKPVSLPPRGRIVRKKPTVGQKIYVIKQGDRSEWVPATIESLIIDELPDKQFNYVYKVRVTISPTTVYLKEVTEEQMAYFEPSNVRMAVGNRVISALYTKKNDEPVKYFAGIIAESPSSNNNYRYLIFFDSMSVQYSNHEDLRVTCEMKEDVHEYFPPCYQNFIRKYFEMLPKRKILTVNTMDIVKVVHKGSWVDAKVTAVDGLLMEVFYKQGLPTEWIYRGSPTVLSKELYRTKLFKALSDGSSLKQTVKTGVVAEDDPSDIEKVKKFIATNKSPPKPDSLLTVRAVARKTITRTFDLPTMIRPLAKPIYQSRCGKDEFAGYIKVFKDLGAGILFPRELDSDHNCSELCISWTNKSLDTCRGRNPLVIPMLFAFKRVDVTPMGAVARQIYYESPCGRKLDDFDQLLTYLQITKCQLSVDYFNFDPWVNVWEEFKASSDGLLLKDLSYGKEFSPIPVVNTVDRDLPPYLNYIVMRKATDGVPLNLDPEFLTGCNCEDDCSNKSTCPCWQKTVKDYLDLIVTSNSEIDAGANLMDYSNIGYQNKRLVEYVPSGIYECNSTCKCSHTCLNRVVQLPLKVKLELFKTKFKGWGTRCLNDIPAGGFICVYVGNILTEKAANEGGKTYGDEYFAELDYIEVMERLMNKPGYESGPSDPENTDEEDNIMDLPSGSAYTTSMSLRSQKKDDKKNTRLKRSTTDQGRIKPPAMDKVPDISTVNKPSDEFDGTVREEESPNSYVPLRLLYGNLYSAKESVYIIDAKTAGNIGRYFNHSCEPNIFVQNVFVDTHDLRFPWVAFFAKHHIRAGSELTWDYQYIVDSVPGKKLYCYCGSRNCRGRLL